MDRLRKLAEGNKFAEFPPNCLQFRSICLGFYEDLKLPKPSVAWQEIQCYFRLGRIHWSHPVVSYVATKITKNVVEMDDEARAYQLFKSIYEKVCMRLKEGHALPKAAPMFVSFSKTNHDVAKTHLNKIREILGVAA